MQLLKTVSPSAALEPNLISVAVEIATDVDLEFLRMDVRPDLEGQSCRRLGIVDLFSGCGGLSVGAIEGARRSGVLGEVQLATDVWSEALAVLGRSLGVPLERTPVLDLSAVLGGVAEPDRSTEKVIVERGIGADLLVAGPPCQGHSALNNHTRHDDARNDLYLAVARVARLLKPRTVIIENVRGVSRDRRTTVQRCTAALEEIGYQVEGRTLDLHQLGAPQRRVRHVLVATQEGTFDFEGLPALATRNVRWGIEDLDGINGSTLFDTASVPTADNARRMRWLRENPDHADLPNRLRPPCHQTDHSYRSMYGRLSWDLPAQTITSGFGSMGQGRFVHPSGARTLTPHEAARLQFLPDFMDFREVDRRGHLATMIGNAAPPILTMSVVGALIDQQLM